MSTKGGRPRVPDRAVANAIWYVLWTGCQWKAIHRDWFGVSLSVVHERFQRWRRMGVFEKLMKRIAEYYARQHGGIGWKWQAMVLLLWEARKRATTPPTEATHSRFHNS